MYTELRKSVGVHSSPKTGGGKGGSLNFVTERKITTTVFCREEA